ncbi:MAG TPA: branched-chain amino acid ABC transporter permease [Stellaceae bacterium]|nr:branched-chain amino acid ABC transporter permease [Stellaceae bacterium]
MALSRRTILHLALIAAALAVPLSGDIYYTRFATQIAMYGMAAVSCDLLLGYGGLVTFGQAAFFGVGAYVTGILTNAGYHDALVVWPAAIAAAALAGLAIGALSLRAQGFQFIMVTLAFGQMSYYIAQALRAYGGDNGFTMPRRNTLAGMSLANHVILYYVSLALLVIVLFLAWRLVNSQFGMVIRGRRDNERRLAAIGIPPFRYKLALFVISAAIAGLAGALMANHARFVSPALLSFQVSGQFLAMVILGSAGTLIGPVFGAAIYLVFQQVLSDYTDHWMIFFGPLLVARVLFVKEGVWGMILQAVKAHEATPAPVPAEEGAAE